MFTSINAELFVTSTLCNIRVFCPFMRLMMCLHVVGFMQILTIDLFYTLPPAAEA